MHAGAEPVTLVSVPERASGTGASRPKPPMATSGRRALTFFDNVPSPGPCIYAIVHSATGRAYVGSAKDLPARWRDHWRDLRKGRHTSPHLQSAWTKYGQAAFDIRVLETCEPAVLRTREQWWLDQYFSDGRALNGSSYAHWHEFTEAQKAKIGQIRQGRRHSPATRAAISAALRASPASALAIRKAQSMVSPVRTPEQREKIRQALLGRKASDATRAKMRGPRPHTRNPKSDEARQHMREAWTRRLETEAQRHLRGQRTSESLRRAYAEGRRHRVYRPLSLEQRQKISQALRQRVAVMKEASVP